MGISSKGGEAMKYKHMIIICSSYSRGKRIARHYLLPEDLDKVSQELEKIYESCGRDIPISTHVVITSSKSWESVKETDGFFKGVINSTNIDTFIASIKKDRVLTGIDIANYILSRKRFFHVKIEKLVYYCYAEYLCRTDDKLFEDKIFAYDKGPVVKTVYDTFHTKKGPLPGKYDYMPIRSRILFAENGISKLSVIDDVIATYGLLKSDDLVKLTHKPNTPWSQTDNQIKNNEIIDSLIKEFHYIECI